MSEHLRRGNKLWESNRMFLPEHKQALMDRKQKQKEFQFPRLDADQFEEINRLILESIAANESVTITYYDIYGPQTFWGWITKINEYEKWLKMINDEDTLILKFERILSVEKEG